MGKKRKKAKRRVVSVPTPDYRLEERRFKNHSTYRQSWNLQESADASIYQGLHQLRARSRYLQENHDLYISVIDELINQIVGTGLQVAPMGTSTRGRRLERFNDEMLRIWEGWIERPEATRELNWTELQRKVCFMWLVDGEVFLRDVTSGLYRWEPDAVRYSMEVIESDYVPHQFVPEVTPAEAGHRLGVELDEWNRPVLYYFYKSHPGDRFNLMPATLQDLRKVSADRVGHLKFTRRWPQTRGQPIAHAAFDRIADIYQYEEYERIAAKMGASLGVAITKDIELAGKTKGVYGTQEPTRTMSMAAGQIYDLLPGESVETVGVNRPNPELTQFRASQMRALAAGCGVKYSTVARDYDGSYSSQRQEMVESEVGYMKLRDYFVQTFVRRTYRKVLEAAILQGMIELPRTATLDTATRIEVNGPGTPWIDPLKEVQADIAALNAGLTTRAAIIRKRGGDPERVAQQLELEGFDNAASNPGANPDDSTSDGGDTESGSGDADGGSGAVDRNSRIAIVR